MSRYRVIYEVIVDAEDEVDAIQEAHLLMGDPAFEPNVSEFVEEL